MALDKSGLREHIVFIESIDRRRRRMDAKGYQRSARELVRVVRGELGDLPIQAFLSDTVAALEAAAQNVFFDSHGRFAETDGSGNARRAQVIADLVIARLRQR